MQWRRNGGDGMKTITMSYDEYINEIQTLKNENEELKRRHDLFTKALKPVFAIENTSSEGWVLRSEWTKKQTLESFVKYVNDTIVDTIGWS